MAGGQFGGRGGAEAFGEHALGDLGPARQEASGQSGWCGNGVFGEHDPIVSEDRPHGGTPIENAQNLVSAPSSRAFYRYTVQ
ncbi:hypothetical protein GCM10011610_24610 [Nocardia rhizosphaerihabitans]|uniref:Uncharacterized protein n=1 Tax=Nocardia rhizosphaerihabitans TaxID=1691570 RepID=A0ABQ2KCQ8_9NOCA|nr:hypothetical protein GCM10011610_24610 [Nocardia rhizosphaerihabitans]